MKLYYIAASCSLASHITLNELGLDLTLIKVDHKTHCTETGDDYFKVNSFGYVPAVELDDGTFLRAGPAILQYLGDCLPKAPTWPQSK